MPRLLLIAPARAGGRQTGGALRPFCVCTARVSGRVQALFFGERKEKTDEKARTIPADGLCDGHRPTACHDPGGGGDGDHIDDSI